MKRKILYILSIISAYVVGSYSLAKAEIEIPYSWFVVHPFLQTVWKKQWELTKWILKQLVTIVTEVLKITFEGFLTMVMAFINTLDIGPFLLSTASAWGLLDSNIAWMVSASGITQGLVMLGLAYVIRVLLNLIPAAFTRI